MRVMPRVQVVFRWAAVGAALCLPAATGCFSGKFFTPTCATLTTTACTGTTSTTSTTGTTSTGSTYGSYAYVANATIGTMTGIPVPTASFSSLTGTSYNLGTPPSALVGTPSGSFLYVATAAGPVFVYTIGSGGALTLGNNGSQVTSTLTPTYIAIDPSGNWLFLLSFSSPQLLVFQINTSTGVLTQTGQGTIALTGGNPTQVYVTPNGQNVYVGLSTGGLDTFAFNPSSGVLTNHLHYAPRGAGADNAIAADNKSAFLFVGEAGTGIRVFSIGSGGALSEISSSPFLTSGQLGPYSIVTDPTNSYVYVAYRTSNDIVGYSLGSGGALTELSSSPFSTGTNPVALSLDSTGKYLFAINNGGNPDLQVFSLDSTTGGKLDPVTSGATGTDPAGAISLSVVP